MSGFDVAEAVRSAAAADAHAWRALVDQYTDLVWAVARGQGLARNDAADVVQNTWLRLTEHLSRLTEPAAVGAWLVTTARNESRRILRQSQRAVPVEVRSAARYDGREPGLDGSPENESEAWRDDTAPPADTWVLDAERDAELWRAFERLPTRCRGLLRMLIAEPPPSYADVSQALEIPIGSIGPTRSRCLQHLRSVFEPLSEDCSTTGKVAAR